MAKRNSERVREVSFSTGSGPITLARPVIGYRSLAEAGCVDGDTVDLTIEGVSSVGAATGDWEVGTYTWNSGVLTRTSITASSNGGAPVHWTNGTRWVNGRSSGTGEVNESSVPFTISGSPTAGQTLSVVPGTGWTVTGNWTRNGINISGATALDYLLASADVPGPVTFQGTNPPYKAPALVVAAGGPSAFVYYVDPAATGNGSGTSEVNAFTSFAPVITLGAAIANKAIGVRRGTTFDETILTAPNIRIGAFGSGARPHFTPMRALTGSWAATSGQTNIYEMTLAGATVDTKRLGNVKRNGVMMPAVSSLAALAAAANGTCFVSGWTTATPTVYVKAAAAPTTDVYSFPFKNCGLVLNGDGWLVEDIDTSGAAHQDGSFRGLGRNGVTRRCSHSDGPRHAWYAYPGVLAEDCDIGPCRNDLEGSANTAVVNDQVALGEGYTFRRTRFIGTGGNQVTGPLMHDGTVSNGSPNLMGIQLLEDCEFIDLISPFTFSGDMRVVRPKFTNVTGGAVSGSPGATLTVSDVVAGSTIDQLTNTTRGGAVTVTNAVFNIRTLPTGFYRMNSSSDTLDVALTLTNVKEVVQGGVTPGNNAHLIRHARGPVVRNNCDLTQPNDEPLFAPIDLVMDIGFAATSTYTGNNNKVPFGSAFKIGGMTYYTLAELQAATSQDAASTVRQPVPTGSDDFNRADENLELNAFWTAMGVAGMGGVRSNQMGTLGNGSTLYRHEVGAVKHWVRFTVASVPATANPYVVHHATDALNWAGVRATTANWQLGKCIAGTVTAAYTSSSAVVPAAGQDVVHGGWNDQSWLYVGERMLLRNATMNASALTTATGIGIMARGASVLAFIDNLQCGVGV